MSRSTPPAPPRIERVPALRPHQEDGGRQRLRRLVRACSSPAAPRPPTRRSASAPPSRSRSSPARRSRTPARRRCSATSGSIRARRHRRPARARHDPHLRRRRAEGQERPRHRLQRCRRPARHAARQRRPRRQELHPRRLQRLVLAAVLGGPDDAQRAGQPQRGVHLPGRQLDDHRARPRSVLLTNGAQPCNVYWKIGASATLGTNSRFIGTVMALTTHHRPTPA